MASWSDSDFNGSNDTWSDPLTSQVTTLADLNLQNNDADNDGATNDEEASEGSDPFSFDTDYDGLSDGDELHLVKPSLAVSLTDWDTDNDEVSDYDEWHNFSGVTYPGGQLPSYPGASYSDYDGDGFKNPVDPQPTVPYDPTTTDSDSDNWYDAYDPFPNDPTNFSPINGIAWGQTFHDDQDGDLLLNWEDPVPYGPSDSDSDGITDGEDPYPIDPYNYSQINHIYWHGEVRGDSDNDGTLNWEDPQPYGPPDSDSDGIIDEEDPYPSDPNNYSETNYVHWYAEVLGDSDNDGTPNWQDPQPYGPPANDADADGFANDIDPFAFDASNYSAINNTNWYADVLGDIDSDQILNWTDPFPNDSTNYSAINSTSWHADVLGDADSDTIQNWQDGAPYGDTPPPPDPDSDGDGLTESTEAAYGTSDSDVDCDDDGLTDHEELVIYYTNPLNMYHLSQTAGWGDLYTDYQMVDPTDFDGDSIPDRIELHYGMLPNDAADAAGDLDGNGISNSAQYAAGRSLLADILVYDGDGDGMTDVFEDAHQLNKNYFGDAMADEDMDGVFNFEESKLQLNPRIPDTHARGGLGDLGVLMEAMLYPEGGAPTVDGDSDGIPDWQEVSLTAASPVFTRLAPNDMDGDSMPDIWEHQYGRWKYPTNGLYVRHHDGAGDIEGDGLSNYHEYWLMCDPMINDGGADPDGDGLGYAAELALGTHLWVADTDMDGISDGEEDFDGDGLSNITERSLSTNALNKDTDADGWDDDEEQAMGSNPLSPEDQPILEPMSSYVSIQTRWVHSSWQEHGGEYYSRYWYWTWDSVDPPMGHWEEQFYSTTTPRDEAGQANFSDGTSQPISTFSAAQGALGQVSQMDWQESGERSVSSSWTEITGRPMPEPPQYFFYPDGGEESPGWSGYTEDNRVWSGGSLEVRLAWKPNAPKPHRRHDLTVTFMETETVNEAEPDITFHALKILANQQFSSAGGTNGGAINLVANASTPETTVVKSLVQNAEIRTYDYYWKNQGSATNPRPDDNVRTHYPDSSSPTGYRTKKTDKLKIAQWYDVVNGGVFHPNKIEADTDAFFIRLTNPPQLPSGTTYRAKVWTENASGAVVDSGADVELQPVANQPGTYQSKGLCLVSNSYDDAQATVSGPDNGLNDQSYNAELGGSVKIRFLFGTNPTATTVDMVLPVPVKKTLTVQGYILKSGTISPSDVIAPAAANTYLELAKERLAQVGVELDGTISTVTANPSGVSFGGFFPAKFEEPHGASSLTIPPESVALFTALNPQVDVTFYFVSDFANSSNQGMTVVPKTTSLTAFHNRILIDVPAMADDTLAHEFLHVLMNAVHGPPFNDFLREHGSDDNNLWHHNDGAIGDIFKRTRINDAMYYKMYPTPP
ncbi:hypothetical protein [Roseimicrobium gellanilyticum]|nr:hypothetical protein [Roseimicrobium gellanilyticum]